MIVCQSSTFHVACWILHKTRTVSTSFCAAVHDLLVSICVAQCSQCLLICRAYCYPSITPLKDMETVIHGTSLLSSAFQAAVHGVLRTLIDQLGVTTFNVGISGMAAVDNDLAADFQRGNKTTRTTSVIARCDHKSLWRVYCSCFASHAQTKHGFLYFLGSDLYAIIRLQLATFAMQCWPGATLQVTIWLKTSWLGSSRQHSQADMHVDICS